MRRMSCVMAVALTLAANCYSYTPAGAGIPVGGTVRLQFESPRSVTVTKPSDHQSLTNVIGVEGRVRSVNGDTLVLQPTAVSFERVRDFLPPSDWEVIV